MKIKPTRTCRRKGCNKEFKLYKSTDKYCSAECTYLEQKKKPKKKQKAIPQYTEKRKRESYTYNRKRKVFLNKPENKVCPVMLMLFDDEIKTTEVHHKAGRRGKFLNYVPFWLAVSSDGHKFIHNNPDWSYKNGFSIQNTTVKL